MCVCATAWVQCAQQSCCCRVAGLMGLDLKEWAVAPQSPCPLGRPLPRSRAARRRLEFAEDFAGIVGGEIVSSSPAADLLEPFCGSENGLAPKDVGCKKQAQRLALCSCRGQEAGHRHMLVAPAFFCRTVCHLKHLTKSDRK